MYGTQTQFNPKKRLTLYDQNGNGWGHFGSRQSKRQQSQNHHLIRANGSKKRDFRYVEPIVYIISC